MVDPRNSVNFLAGLLIRRDSCCRQPLMSPAFWNNTPVSDRIDLLTVTSDLSRCCGEGTKECWGELSALSPSRPLSLSLSTRPFSCNDFIAANGNGSHVFAIIPHIVIMRQSHKAHAYSLSRVRAHSTKLFIKPYGFVFSLYIGRGSSLKENNRRETSVLDEYLKDSYHEFLIIAFFPQQAT